MRLIDAFLKLKLDDMVKRPNDESTYDLRFLMKIYSWSLKARKRLFKSDISDEDLYAEDWEIIE